MTTNVSELEKAYREDIEWLIAQALEEESQFPYGEETEYLVHFTRCDIYRDAADHLQHTLDSIINNHRKRETMATNVSERDKAMREVMGLIDKRLEHMTQRRKQLVSTCVVNELQDLKKQIESMLGYSGSMPSEVPNQSEDAK